MRIEKIKSLEWPVLHMNYEAICDILRFLALKSGKIIMDVYNSNNVEVLMKSDNSPVTIADKKADEVITKGLKNYFPCLLYTSPSPRD